MRSPVWETAGAAPPTQHSRAMTMPVKMRLTRWPMAATLDRAHTEPDAPLPAVRTIPDPSPGRGRGRQEGGKLTGNSAETPAPTPMTTISVASFNCHWGLTPDNQPFDVVGVCEAL